MYTTNEEGILNNYAIEPKMSYSEYPSPEQQRRYALQGGVALLLITSLILIAFAA
ncbi:MAG TPA: ssl1498 family light-harvesting-like protein [Leptolyngbyaceae cyanobacterium]